MTTNLIITANEWTNLDAVKAAVAAEAAEATYMEGLGFVSGEEAPATFKIGFLEAAARAAEVAK